MNLDISLLIVSGVLISTSSTAWAQSTDPGRVFDSVQPRTTPASPTVAPAVQQREVSVVAPAAQALTQQVDVRAFRIEGASLLSSVRLQKVVEPFTGRSLTPAQFQQAAASIAQAYRDAGYPLVQAFVLPQAINDGIVVITVREDQLISINVAQAQAPSIVQRELSDALRLQQALNVVELEQALLLINNLPGRGRVAAEIIPPAQGNASSLDVSYAKAPKLQGSITIDNAGNRFTGKSRLLGQFAINEPLNSGDQLSLTLLSTGKYLTYAQAGYRTPLTLRWSLGVSASHLGYVLCCQVAGVNSEGSAQSLGLDAAYQLNLQRGQSSTLFANLDSRRLDSKRNGIAQTDRQVDALSLGMRAYSATTATRSWNAAVRAGRADLRGNALDLVQNASTGIQGNFSKLTAGAYQFQYFTPAWSWELQARGQLNLGRNLEGSERFALGGADGVRAYPSGEGVGDTGALLSSEVRYAIAGLPGLSVAAFADAGNVRRYSRNVPAVLSLMGQASNSYTLAGAGIGIRYTGASASVNLQAAKRLGNNRGADSASNNNEGRRDGQTQVWLSAAWRF